MGVRNRKLKLYFVLFLQVSIGRKNIEYKKILTYLISLIHINLIKNKKIKQSTVDKMVDTYDLFRKLGSGAQFDMKRFRNDAAKFQVREKPQKN